MKNTRMTAPGAPIKVGVAGFGYWGPNFARNFAMQDGCSISAICEVSPQRAAIAAKSHPAAAITSEYERLVSDSEINVIAIATPVGSHYALARRALLAGKDVLVAKPLCISTKEAEELAAIAAREGRILGVDHTFLFTPAVQKLKEIISRGDLGQILYIDGVRINLGLFQSDVNVIYDLAPHDIAITNYLLDQDPQSVRVMAHRGGNDSMESVAYIHLEYSEQCFAHFHLSWLSPVKLRRYIIAGSAKMAVYDDMQPTEKVLIYEKGITIRSDSERYKVLVDYRMGDMIAPKLLHAEPLAIEIEMFLESVRTRKPFLSDGAFGVRVVRVLEAAAKAVAHGQ